MRIIKKITIDRILSKVYNDFGLDEVDEGVIVEWIGDVLSQIGVDKAYEERVAFLEVKNHQAEIPNDIISLKDISKNIKYIPNEENYSCKDFCNCSKAVVEEKESISCKEEITMFRDCWGRLIIPDDYERVYFTPNFKLSANYSDLVKSVTYEKCFVPLFPSKSVYKALKICDDTSECKKELYSPEQDEYTVINNVFRFSFKEGQVAISYIAQPTDIDTGYPLIPDDISVINAITNYILFMYCRKMHIIGRDGYKEKYQEAEQNYHWYLSQAKNKLYGLYGVDEHQEFTESYLKFLPNKFKYSKRFR